MENTITENTQTSLRKRLLIAILTLVVGLLLTWLLASSITSQNSSVFKTLPIVYAVAVIYGTIQNFLNYGKNTKEESQPQIIDEREYDYWEAYGLHLKKAYSSKFGGANSGFNQEVDARVSIMLNNGTGFTRTLAKDWLKRMHKFTEAK